MAKRKKPKKRAGGMYATSININEKIWREFRMICIDQDKYIGDTLQEVVKNYVEQYKIQQNELDTNTGEVADGPQG